MKDGTRIFEEHAGGLDCRLFIPLFLIIRKTPMDAFQSCTLAPPDDALISVIKKYVLGPFLFKALMITT